MTGESLAIIAVILVLAGMFLRAKKRAVALMTLPLISVPLFYLPVRGLSALTGLPLQTTATVLVVLGVVLGSAACSLLSLMIPTKKGKTGYLVFTLIFQVAIAIGYLINIL